MTFTSGNTSSNFIYVGNFSSDRTDDYQVAPYYPTQTGVDPIDPRFLEYMEKWNKLQESRPALPISSPPKLSDKKYNIVEKGKLE